MKKTATLVSIILSINSIISQTITEFSSGYTSLEGVAINSNNEVYISENNSGKIFKLDDSGNNTLITTAGGFANDIVFDTNNNLYVTEPFTNKISILDSSTNTLNEFVSTSSSGTSPYGIDSFNGLIYFSSENNGKVIRVNADLSTTEVASGLFTPEGISIDSKGNLYVADRNDRSLFKIDINGLKTTIASNIRNIRGVTVSPSDDVYFTTYNSFPLENKILKYNSNTGVLSDFVTTQLDQPRSLEIDHLGNMYVTNIGNGTVVKIFDESLQTTPTLSVESFEKLESAFKLFPNPVITNININIPIKKIILFDTKGENIYEENPNSKSINIENLSSGVYFAQILSDKNQLITRQVIKK